MTIRISQQELTEAGGGHFKLSLTVTYPDGEIKTLWAIVPETLIEYIDLDSYNWALLTILIPAMKTRQNIKISGSVSNRLYRAAQTDLQDILIRLFDGKLGLIQIDAEKISTKTDEISPFSGIGFSAGIDSLSSLALLRANTLCFIPLTLRH